jgi:hypothetical protein
MLGVFISLHYTAGAEVSFEGGIVGATDSVGTGATDSVGTGATDSVGTGTTVSFFFL